MSLRTFLPGLPLPDLIQLYIFLGLFGLSSFALVSNWLGSAYLITNLTLLFVCFFTIALPQNAKIYYLFSFALLLSVVLDILSIAINWSLFVRIVPGFNFFIGFVLALILIVGKVFVALHQYEIAKTVNGEESPIKISKIFAPINRQVSNQHQRNADIEAPNYQETTTTSYQETYRQETKYQTQPPLPPSQAAEEL